MYPAVIWYLIIDYARFFWGQAPLWFCLSFTQSVSHGCTNHFSISITEQFSIARKFLRNLSHFSSIFYAKSWLSKISIIFPTFSSCFCPRHTFRLIIFRSVCMYYYLSSFILFPYLSITSLLWTLCPSI